MRETEPWHEQDAFWETVAPILFSQRRRSNAPVEVDQVVSLLGLEPGMHVLDLCCGVGRHSLELVRRGFHVTGVDRTQTYLEQASKQAKTEGLSVEFVQDDMRNFCRLGAFEAVINLFTSFGYFEDSQDDRKVVTNVYQSLKAGGVFLIDMMGKEVLARVFRERDWYEENGSLILEERKLGKCWDWLETRWVLFRENEWVEHRLSLHLYSAVELSSLLTGCGFAQVDIYGDFAGNPYDHTAKRLVAVARK
jgi:SAM-dependent methyltransferase